MNNSLTLIDTDVAINYIKKGLVSGVSSQTIYGSNISRITYIELVFGYYKTAKRKELDKITEFISDLSIDIIELDDEISHQFCKLKIDLQKKGEVIPDFDLIIASTAIVNNFKLYTLNLKHFSRINQLKLV